MRRTLSIGLRLLLPVLMIFGLRLPPRPLNLDQALYAARTAHGREWHDIESTAWQLVAAYQPWRTGIWERIGVEALASGELDTALSAFLKAESRSDLSSQGRAAYGETYWQQGQIDKALQVWKPLLESGSANVRLYERIAGLWRNAGDRSRLTAVLRLWAAAYPEMAQPAYELGILLLPDEPEEAQHYLRSAGNQDVSLRGRVFTLEQALMNAALQDQPAYGQVLLGRTLASLGEWEAAGRSFELAVRTVPEYAEAWAFLAEARQQTGGSGRTEIEKALAADPESVAARVLAALYWRRAGVPETALVFLEGLAMDYPQQGLWQVEIANTLAEMGKYDQAMDRLQQAVAVEPENAELWRILGRFSVDNYLEMREIGLPAARQAVRLAPANADMHDLMGLVLLQLEDETGAERFLQQALQINPTHASAHLHLGQLYLNQEKFPQAAAHLRQARDSSGESQAGVRKIAERLLEQYGFAGQ